MEPIAPMIKTVSIWRCKCGARLKAVSESQAEQPSATSVAACPQCGEQHVVDAAYIISVTLDVDETSPAAPTD